MVANESGDRIVDIRKNFNFITLIESGRNVGFAAANNITLPHVKTEYVCFFLNTDVVLKEDIIETQISVLDKDVKVGLTACCLLNSDASF